MNISYVICAAGAGTRMKDVSTAIPKPLLKMGPKTLTEISCESLPLQPGDQVIFISQKSFFMKRQLNEVFVKLYPRVEFTFLEIEVYTSGQAETALLARPHVRHKSLAIFNCDTYFHASRLREYMLNPEVEGLIPCSKEPGDSWSFCEIEPEQDLSKVIRVEEKKRISPWCSAGFYYFRDSHIFWNLVVDQKKIIKEELYIAPLYNELIRQDKKIFMCECEIFKAMGTPTQISHYFHLSVSQMKNFNSELVQK